MTYLTFGAALERLKCGAKIARAGWNGKGMWLALSPGVKSLEAGKFWAGANREYAVENGGAAEVLPCITMKTATGEILMGWLASQSDMLANDWLDLSPAPEGLAAYQCHKVVLAGCIHAIEQDGYQGGFCRLIFTRRDELAEEVGLPTEQLSIVVPASYVDRCKPMVGGYYVLYSGGYESYSPAPEFINGYTRLPA